MCVCSCVRCTAAVSTHVLHKIYKLNVPEMYKKKKGGDSAHPCDSVSMCARVLPSVLKDVSADVLLCRLIADYDIKCLWALISDSPKVRPISYPRWPLLNGILMDAQWSPIRCNRETCACCIKIHAHTSISGHAHTHTHSLIHSSS